MYHKISEFCDVISVMYEKSMQLRRMKYDTPKYRQDIEAINFLIADIQALASKVARDRGKYVVDKD